jgi:hypothetical protein
MSRLTMSEDLDLDCLSLLFHHNLHGKEFGKFSQRKRQISFVRMYEGMDNLKCKKLIGNRYLIDYVKRAIIH